MLRSLLLFFILLLASIPSLAQEVDYEIREVTAGKNIPWEIRWGHDGWIWFTERHGRISRVNPETGECKVLLVAPTVLQIWESGMLGFDFHPNFPDSPYIYVAYTHEETWPAKLDLFRYTYTPDTLTDRKLVFTGMRSNYTHVGCRVVIRGDKIFLTVGDVDDKLSAQDGASLNGKILRINIDGSIPEDNPWPGSAVWTKGHRNPQGLTFGPTGILYSSEHGWYTDDELNIIEPGNNYGWPLVQGRCDHDTEMVSCDTLNVRQPIHDWYSTYGVSAAEFYNHDAIPEWKNSVLVTALKNMGFLLFKMDSTGRNILEYREIHPDLQWTGNRAGRIRDYCFSPDGNVFFSTSNTADVDEPIDAIYEFKKIATRPYYVTQITPANESVVYADTAMLVWRRTAGDSYYRVEVATNSDFAVGSVLHELTTTDTAVVVHGLSFNTNYYWRVKEITSGGPWTGAFQFSIPANSVDRLPAASGIVASYHDEHIVLTLIGSHSTVLPVKLIDTRGAMLWGGSIPPGSMSYTVKVHGIPSGSYQIVVGSGDHLLTKQVVIVR